MFQAMTSLGTCVCPSLLDEEVWGYLSELASLLAIHSLTIPFKSLWSQHSLWRGASRTFSPGKWCGSSGRVAYPQLSPQKASRAEEHTSFRMVEPDCIVQERKISDFQKAVDLANF
jgi:hypothetical protein